MLRWNFHPIRQGLCSITCLLRKTAAVAFIITGTSKLFLKTVSRICEPEIPLKLVYPFKLIKKPCMELILVYF